MSDDNPCPLPPPHLPANLTMFAWLRLAPVPRHDLQFPPMRPLEPCRYMLRATNTGVTAIIN